MINHKRLNSVIEFSYSPNRWMKKHHPKAARKRRIVKKWLNKYGRDPIERIFDEMMKPSLFLEAVKKSKAESWHGGSIRPLNDEDLEKLRERALDAMREEP